MEFKLNKIDTDIRRKMQEEVKEEKVHSGKAIDVKRDIKDYKKEPYTKEEKNSTKEETTKRYITIDGVKLYKKEIDIDAEKIEEINEENSKGRILDTKK